MKEQCQSRCTLYHLRKKEGKENTYKSTGQTAIDSLLAWMIISQLHRVKTLREIDRKWDQTLA